MLALDYIDTNHALYTHFLALGIPTKTTEHYKNFPIENILAQEYLPAQDTKQTLQEKKELHIHNATLIEYPKGVDVHFENHFDVSQKHFDSLYYMSHILTPTIIVIELDRDISFTLRHSISQEHALLNYRIVVKVHENVHAEIFETFSTQGSENSFTLYGLDIDLAKNSSLTWIRNENRHEDETRLIGSHAFSLATQASLKLQTFDFGSSHSLHLYTVDLDSYATADASHLLVANNKARRGNVIYINHNDKHAQSIQEARSIIKDTATGIFDAKILVAHDAKYAKASQNAKAILVDNNARMYAKPQLEIYTDELEASHGSTIGTLDKDALFYLRSRGISLQDARTILMSAFSNTLIETIENKSYEKEVYSNLNSLL